MGKVIVIINGFPRSGKDTFTDYCLEILDDRFKKAVKISSVDKVKKAAALLGYTGAKTDNERNFLAALKFLASKHFDHSFKYVTEYVDTTEFDVYFVMIRESAEIEKLVEYYKTSNTNVLTVLITSPNSLVVDNEADKNVYKYAYSYTVHNNNSLKYLEQLAGEFIDDIHYYIL